MKKIPLTKNCGTSLIFWRQLYHETRLRILIFWKFPITVSYMVLGGGEMPFEILLVKNSSDQILLEMKINSILANSK